MRTIFDIAGLPAVRGHDLVAHLVGQAESYGPHYLLGHRVVELTHGPALRPVDALGLDRFHLVGHHTGGVIAVELAARLQDRVASLLLSATPFIDDEKRRTAAERKPVDEEAALTRFMVDALTVLDRVEEGHVAVRGYETRVLSGGLMPLPEQLPGEFAKVVLEWTAAA
ncbi:alpha/beta fold hydrolase [Streptomyces fulvoviolaceus]|uniref:alpha/beta fold hydrolase n=1 Tax=Streptomyces fulvoviolaceus TaxID=285535 RepID=UPI001F461549|nr:alpha/beta fold hydrolase [Streptomyces fulvoviolaceus]